MSGDIRSLDEAINLVTRRTRDAQEAFVEVPPEDEEALRRVVVVERRADDLDTLANEAAAD
jgi:hypothetical protein